MAVVSIPNGSFEFGGITRGSADEWTKLSSVADMLPACFDGTLFMGITIIEGFGFESFELWGGLLGDLDDAVAAQFTPDGETFDGFEQAWQNSLFFFEFEDAILAHAIFNVPTPTLFEGFEQKWNNDVFDFDWSTVTAIAAMFDPGLLEPFEDFEEEWKSNEDFDFDWTTIVSDTAMFDSGVNSAEDFEGVWDLILDI